MIRTSFRRSSRSRFFRTAFLILIVLALVDVFSLVSTRQHQFHSQEPLHHEQNLTIYIASIHWNNERIIRNNWSEAVVDLAKYFGPNNIYISIYESGSWDDTKGALRLLDSDLGKLGVPRNITFDTSTHADELQKPVGTGWVDTPRGRKELRRIPYLSRLRNESLKPLAQLARQGTKFDRVLFLNDVVFTTEDVVNLLSTREGHYAAACSLDYTKPPAYYDTFALRDSDGYEAVTSTYPYFRSKASRNAIITGQPVPVQSCWNGIVVLNAAPFYDTNPLEFRGIPDSLASYHLEGSECCLIHADNPLTSTSGVWVNPKVRVGYSQKAYTAVHDSVPWPSTTSNIAGIWNNRIWRWITPTGLKASKVNSRLSKWKKGDESRKEPGAQCLINEMQVLVENGWAHV